MTRTRLFTAVLLIGLLFNPSALRCQAVSGPLVVAGGWPECTSLATWTRDVLRLDRVEQASGTRQGISVYTWLRLFNRVAEGGMQHAWEGPPGEEAYVLDVHKHLFVYGWGYCDTQSRIFEALWREWTGDSTSAYRVCRMNERGGYHTMYRVRLDGSYGAFDPRFGFYLLDRDSPDARVLDWAGVGDDRSFERNEKFRNRCRPFFEYAVTEKAGSLALDTVFFESEPEWIAAGKKPWQVFNDPYHLMGTAYHDMNWRLPRGTVIERYWDNSARKFYLPLNRGTYEETPALASGRFYRVTEKMFVGNWPRFDPNYLRAEPYLAVVPADEGYPEQMAGDRTIGQAWGRLSWEAPLDGEGYLDAVAASHNMVHQARAPFLRPASASVPGEVVFDFYCPFVLVDGVFSGELAAAGPEDRVSLEFRAMLPKPLDRGEADEWTGWREIASGPGAFEAFLGRDSYERHLATVHGRYRFQLRLKAYCTGQAEAVGLKALAFKCFFETGIMSIPQIFAGENALAFKVNDQQAVKAPIKFTYNYQTRDGERTSRTVIDPGAFSDNRASFVVGAPGLVRCNSLVIEY
ncbi:MAG: hypothetical protein JXQ83_08765 [Candidatus Glassbacteria bacterium]|nr:hypothetical protein [Candidatus Glassbacteria bacterium]